MRNQSRITFILLLTPLVLWLGLLIIIPHIDMLLISLRERISFGVYERSLTQYEKALTEPLYLRTFWRTAVMSVLATAITLVIAFPVSYDERTRLPVSMQVMAPNNRDAEVLKVAGVAGKMLQWKSPDKYWDTHPLRDALQK